MRWILRNLTALGLALALAVTIWVVAVTEEDPFEEKPFPDSVPITITGLPDGMMIVGNPRPTADLQIRAPRSVWAALSADQLHVYADLSNAPSGVLTVPLTAVVDNRDSRITGLTPQEIQLTLEQIVVRQIPIRLEISGDPATGYKAGEVTLSPLTASISGPASAADSVSELVARLSLNNAKQTITQDVDLTPINSAGRTVPGVTLEPRTVAVSLPVEQLGGYRDVAVKAIIEGQVVPGFRITNISISPLVVTLFSADPNIVASLPGFVETETIDINTARDDVEVRATLNLPPGVSLVGDQTVLIQINIAAIESSVTIQHDLEIQGLGPGLSAAPSPASVDVILDGPLPTLDSLTHDSIRVVLNLLGLPPGIHQVKPDVVVLPDGVRVQTILPATIEVLIAEGDSTATASPSATPSLTLTLTLTPTRAPTRAPTLTLTATP